MSVVICEMPKAGLGNQLFPLMKAALFAKINDLPLKVVGYNQLKIGPYLRREKSKRKYNGYFKFQKGLVGERLDKLALLRYRNLPIQAEPKIGILGDRKIDKRFVFTTPSHWSDFFAELREYREEVLPIFDDLLSDDIRAMVKSMVAPCIGVHIRLGDFLKLKEGADFKSGGGVRTPEQYFIETIDTIRRINGKNLSVSVFSDGYEQELKNILALDNVSLVKGNPDIVDMLLLARSKIIVTSAQSTFSYWSGFLSDVPLIMHPDHLHTPVRPENKISYSFEGVLAQHLSDESLIKSIKGIVC